ncbi:MAG: Ig-like domain-containing protein [Acidobacteria bacterium]|nr:Ig-like domain-containing protein [Acidobacteriota bacterium]
MDDSNRAEGTRVSAHEGGHNLTLQHSSSRDFGADVLAAPGVQGALSEYGDQYSNMGSSGGHYTISQKVQLGWASMSSGSHQVQTVQSNGAFTLIPADSAAPGLKGLKVTRGTDNANSNWLYIEYRQNGGSHDTTSTSAGHNNAAVIHYEDSSTRSSGKTHLLDYTPANGWNDVGLATGQTWQDPYSNLSISVGAATPTSLGVTVTFGPIPCIEGNPTVSVAPSSQSAFAGGSAAFTVTVTNNDNSGCSPTTFALSSTQPAGWTSDLGPASLTLGNGSTNSNQDSATFTVFPLAGETEGSFDVSVTGTHANGANSATSPGTVHLQVPLSDIAISAVNAPSSATVGSTVNVNVTVQNTGNQNVSGDIDVTLTDTTDGDVIGTQTLVGGLASGASANRAFSWNTTGVSSPAVHTLTANHDFADANGGNNAASTDVSVSDPLSVASMAPSIIQKGTSATVTVGGSGFLNGAGVSFVNGAGPSPSVSSVNVGDSSTITALVAVPAGGGSRDRVWDLRVTNPGGANATLARALTMSNNAPPNSTPVVSITSPPNGQTYPAGATVNLTGTANDSEDGNLTSILSWSSNVDGAIGTGGSRSWAPSEGTHTITASATDTGGKTGNSSITITVGNAPPSVTITSPASGAIFTQGDTVTLTGTATDPENGALTSSITWTSSRDGSLGAGGSVGTSSLTLGVHTITASVTDLDGKSATDSISITVNELGAITLSANGRNSKGRHVVDLTWSGASGSSVNVDRGGSVIATTANDGSYSDATGNKGTATYTYQVCEAGGSTCSNTVNVSF